MIKNISKKTYILFMLATLLMTTQFDLLCNKQSIPELIEKLKIASPSDYENIFDSIANHPDISNNSYTLTLTIKEKHRFKNNILRSLLTTYPNTIKIPTKCLSNLTRINYPSENINRQRIPIDEIIRIYTLCGEEIKNPKNF